MENLNDINNLDPNDEGLKAVMGAKFHDATKDTAPVKKTEPAPVKAVEAKPEKKTHTVPAALWDPPKPDPSQTDRLKACVKWAAIFGGLSLLFFYWQQNGLMDPTAALPSMYTCAVLAGLSVGRNATK
jgi:hypothetical protein